MQKYQGAKVNKDANKFLNCGSQIEYNSSISTRESSYCMLSARLSHRNYSVRLSVCLSVTRVDQSKTV